MYPYLSSPKHLMFWLDKLEEIEKDPPANSVDVIVFVHPQSSTERKMIVAT